MTELLTRSPLGFNEYGEFVRSSRHNNDDPGWRDVYADYVEAELVEFLEQHGPGSVLLLPEECEGIYSDVDLDDLRLKMGDEMGDSVWFCIDGALRIGKDPMVACEEALRSHVPDSNPQITTFAELETHAVEAADDIKVMNLLGVLAETDEVHPSLHLTSLKQNPHYLLQRMGRRLVRSLHEGRGDTHPLSETELEPIVETSRAIGNYLLVLAYIAKTRLNIPMESIVRFNVAKLSHRRVHGKGNDISFDQSHI
jgi:hypothetical protein